MSIEFAARHDTFEGQRTIQDLHDVAARGGAVCNAPKAEMASRHEASAVQSIHDLVVDGGANCSTTSAARFSGGQAAFDQKVEVDRLLAMTPLGQATLRDRATFTGRTLDPKIREYLAMTPLGRQTLQDIDQPRG